jgi:hypothetical protein
MQAIIKLKMNFLDIVSDILDLNLSESEINKHNGGLWEGWGVWNKFNPSTHGNNSWNK